MFIVAVFSNFERQHIFWNSKMKHPWTIQKLKGRSFLRYKVFYFWFWWLCPILTFPLLFIAFCFPFETIRARPLGLDQQHHRPHGRSLRICIIPFISFDNIIQNHRAASSEVTREESIGHTPPHYRPQWQRCNSTNGSVLPHLSSRCSSTWSIHQSARTKCLRRVSSTRDISSPR